MKKYFTLLLFISLVTVLHAQNKDYPTPEYANELYLLKNDSPRLVRLEKGSSKMETKVKMMGMGGMDNGYALEEEKSPIRLRGGDKLVFIMWSGGTTAGSSPEADSAMRANGMDPASMASMSSMGRMDPSQTTSLYDMNSGKGIMGKSKKTSKKYTLSVKPIRDGYYEFIVDKTLPKGEYAFVVMGMGSMDQSYALFAFGVD
jgi:hypothetical protein